MIFRETQLKGSFLVDVEKLEDSRGFFARTWCQRECEKFGINFTPVQCNISYNKTKGTLRGMHFQSTPHEEAKLVSCIKGGIFDVIIDLRSDSPTFLQHITAVLTAENYRMLYIPKGFAHGFQTLQNDTEVFYQMSEFYTSEYSQGVRWNDPVFGIKWPDDVRLVSDRDQRYPDFGLTQ